MSFRLDNVNKEGAALIVAGVTKDCLLIVENPGFVQAWLSEDYLIVYRSVLMYDDDQPKVIKEMLNRRNYRIMLAQVVDDEHMMFGEGLLSVYRFTD
jgi:hypothetical protein